MNNVEDRENEYIPKCESQRNLKWKTKVDRKGFLASSR